MMSMREIVGPTIARHQEAQMYSGVVIGHVIFVILAFAAHGVSAFAMFRVKREPDRARLTALLDLSESSVGVFAITLLIALILGIVAAAMGDFFGKLWPWASIVVLVVAGGLMTPLAQLPMSRVRIALGLPVRGKPAGPAASDAELAAARARLQPELVAVLGVAAIALLVWLMVAKPF
jgi:hypothetical protein